MTSKTGRDTRRLWCNRCHLPALRALVHVDNFDQMVCEFCAPGFYLENGQYWTWQFRRDQAGIDWPNQAYLNRARAKRALDARKRAQL